MSREEWRKDRWFGVGMGVLSALLTIQSFRYPAESAQFPRFLCTLLLLLSALLLVRVARTPQPRSPEAEPAAPRPAIAAIAKSPTTFVFAASAVYLLAMQWLGFLVSSLCFMLACAWWLGHRRWATGIVWAALFPVALYLLFHSLLGLALPAGWLR
jgi:putative tricarboxylic transport membrane protein